MTQLITKTLDEARALHPDCEVFEVIDHADAEGYCHPAIYVWRTPEEAEDDDGARALGLYWLATIRNLDHLRTLLLDGDLRVVDIGGDFRTDLPTFGGDTPRDTYCVWSWDATRLLVGTCEDDLEIIDRSERLYR